MGVMLARISCKELSPLRLELTDYPCLAFSFAARIKQRSFHKYLLIAPFWL